VGVLLSAVVCPIHAERLPAGTDGSGLTLIPAVVLHPVGRVYDICTVPVALPVTIPPVAVTSATVVLLLLHAPPPVLLASVTFSATQIATLPPDIAAGKGLTVMFLICWQPVPSVYVIIAVPASTPIAVPVEEPMTATAVLLLLHVPPAGLLVNAVVESTHKSELPDIVAGSGCTVSMRVTKQPVEVMVYVILVVPLVTPVAVPVARPIPATVVLSLVHVPPVVADESVALFPLQMAAGPVMAAGGVLIVTFTLPSGPQQPAAERDLK
jgi:hypothetical protein